MPCIVYQFWSSSDTAVTFAPEEDVKFVTVSTFDDDIHDTDRMIMAVLEGGEGVRLESHVATATVEDNDSELKWTGLLSRESILRRDCCKWVEIWRQCHLCTYQ